MEDPHGKLHWRTDFMLENPNTGAVDGDISPKFIQRLFQKAVNDQLFGR